MLAAAPRQPDALGLLGTIRAQRGDLSAAEGLMRDALGVSPGAAGNWNNLGVVLKKQGRLGEAVVAYREALARDPELASAWSNLCDALRSFPSESFDPAIGRDLIACFSRDELPHQDLAATAVRFLHGTDEFHALVARLDAAGPLAFLDAAALRGLCAPLSLLAMERVLMPDPKIERILTAARRDLLDFVNAAAPPRPVSTEHERFAAALARQCFLNEYAYAESEAERLALASLRAALDLSAPVEHSLDRLRIMVFGCYAPLHTLVAAAALDAAARAARGEARFLYVVRRQVVEPLEERNIGSAIPSLGAITDAVSRKVRAQYEDNPYPRWQSAGAGAPRALAEVMAQLFPHLSHERMPAAPLEILVAGCGTGRHAIMSARRFAGARVLAVDLSRASLAYAVRKARELGADSVAFMQADILDLGRLDRSFDVIECVGVLHHMEDPARGLGALSGLLRPNGLMKIGLYSEIARGAHRAARDLVRDHGYVATAEGIRAARQHVLSLPAPHPAHTLVERADFYSLSGCRDLILHVQERRFALPAVAAMLDAAGLEFIGFEFADSWMAQRYRDRFPDDATATSLENWHRYERDNPATFASMYTFWVRQKTPGP